MQDFEGLNAGVKAMETRKAALEQDLWAKEAEIERIKWERSKEPSRSACCYLYFYDVTLQKSKMS